MSKFKIIALIGETCSGKSTLYNSIINDKKFCDKYNIKGLKNLTTRPLRNELENNEYTNVTKEELDIMLKEDKLFNCISFNTVYGEWKYASSKEDVNLDKHNYIIILDPERAYQSIQYFGDDIVIFKMTIPLEERLLNSLKRNDNLSFEEKKRRMSDEEKVFKEYSFKINWETFDTGKIDPRSLDYILCIKSQIAKYLI